MLLQQVVGDEANRTLPSKGGSDLFSSQTTLKHLETQGSVSVLLPTDHLSIEDGAVREPRGDLHQLGKAVVDQLFTTAPQVTAIAAMDQLPADAIPFPFQLPVRGRIGCEPIRVQWAGEKKGVRRAIRARFLSIRFRCEAFERVRRRVHSTHQPLHHKRLVEAKGLGDGAADQPC